MARPNMTMELAVPQVRQLYDYDCGPASLCAVLRFLGVECSIEDCIRLSDADQPDANGEPGGAAPEWLMSAARHFAIVPDFIQGMTVQQLATLCSQGKPVIVMIQAWHSGGRPPQGYDDEWGDGHYAVVTAVRKGSVVLMDPSIDKKRGVLRTREFLDRWHDEDFLEPHPGLVPLHRAGILFSAPAVEKRFQKLARTRSIL